MTSKQNTLPSILIVLNIVNQLLGPFTQIILTYWVIHFKGIVLWGEYVALLIIPGFFLQIISWGNREFLLRAFARNPKHMSPLWQKNLINRFCLYVIFIVIYMFLPVNTEYKIAIIVWSFFQYMNQSFAVLIQYTNTYVYSLLQKIISLVVLVIMLILFKDSLSIHLLLSIVITLSLMRAITDSYYFRKIIFKTASITFDMRLLKKSFPFFALGMSGLLASKIDLYSINYFLSPVELGTYHVFMTFLIFLQALASYTLEPFVKDMYRPRGAVMPNSILHSPKLRFIIPLPCIIAIQLVLTYYYQLHFPMAMYVLAYLYVLPGFLYMMYIYRLFNENRQNEVTVVSCIGTVVNVLGCILLIPKLSIMGALLASVIMQWTIFLLLYDKTVLKNNKLQQTAINIQT